MCHEYIVIHVVYEIELLRTKKILPDFCENMDPDKWDTTVWYQVT